MADRNGRSVSSLRRPPTAGSGFTLIESLVALTVLGFALAIGLGAVAAVQHGLELTVLQRTLDQRLEIGHEALRGGLVDTEQLVEFGRLYVDPSTLESTTLPSVSGGGAQVRIDASAGAVDGLYAVELSASGRRGRIQRTRRLHTQIFVPGAAP